MHRLILPHKRSILICIILALAILAVYGQVRSFDFVDFDDPLYVKDNHQLQKGLTGETIRWAFTGATKFSNYWIPLTWLSFLLDHELYGMNAGGYHMTNVVLHILNALLLFLLFKRMTGALPASAFTAALFALHPLHVESVAWVTERKDVLSTFFWMLTLVAYARYVDRRDTGRYLLVLVSFVLGLMAKPMLVTLPFVLLLLDYWPLGRLRAFGRQAKHSENLPVVRLVWEKAPFFLIIVIASVAAFLTQQAGDAIVTVEAIPLTVRLENVLVAYVGYIGKLIWPTGLSAFYPHPGSLPVWKWAGAFMILASISYLFFKLIKTRPYFAVGWLWYLGTLFPVSGLVVIGPHAMADRYTYVPFVGLYVMISWGVSDLLARWPEGKTWAAASTALLIPFMMFAAWAQVGHWKNSVTLFEHALKVTDDNWLAHNNLGNALKDQGLVENAIRHYSSALRIKPNYEHARNNLGVALEKQGLIEEAGEQYGLALRANPKYDVAHFNLGKILVEQGRMDKAIFHFRQALMLRPDNADAHNNLGNSFFVTGRLDEAVTHYRKALQIQPDHEFARKNLVSAIEKKESGWKVPDHDSKTHLRTADSANLYYQRGNRYRQNDQLDQAILQYQKALSIQPDYIPALNDLALAHVEKGAFDRALTLYQKIISLRPDSYVACYNIACLYARQNQTEEAVKWLEKALQRGFKDWQLLETDEDLKNIRVTPYYKALTHAKQDNASD